MELDWQPVWLTVRLASMTTGVLLLVGLPLAWWLAWTRCRLKPLLMGLVALPLLLSPTVLGFYLLVLLDPDGVVGGLVGTLGLELRPFTFGALVAASVISSLPFVVLPLHYFLARIGADLLEVAATLRAAPGDRFFAVALPLAWPGILAAAGMGFVHALGEFGVMLMLGGTLPGETRVLSIVVYEYTARLEFAQAHLIAAALLLLSLLALLLFYRAQRRPVESVR